MIHFGQMKCGKVDQFGELFHVVSDFLHVNFVPFIPLRSHLVLPGAGAEGGDALLPIPLSLKSVLTAWARTVLVLLILLNSFVLLRNLFGLWQFLVVPGRRRGGLAAQPEIMLDAVLNPLWLVIGFVIFFALTYRFSKASWTRALHLATVAGLSEEHLDDHLARLRAPAPPAETLDPLPD